MTNIIDARWAFKPKENLLNSWFVEAVNDFSCVKSPKLSVNTSLVRELARAAGGSISPEKLLLHIDRSIVEKFKHVTAALSMIDQKAPPVAFADHLSDEEAVIPPLIFGLVAVLVTEGNEGVVSKREVRKVGVTLRLHVFNGVADKEPETQQITGTQIDRASALSFLSPGQVTTMISIMGCDINANRVIEERDLLRFNWLHNATEYFDGLAGFVTVIHDVQLSFETYTPAEKE